MSAAPGTVTRVGRLIGFDIDTRDPDTLRLRARQFPLVFVLLLVCGMLIVLTGVFIYEGDDILGKLARDNGITQLLVGLCLLMLAAAGPAGLIYWPAREAWVFSRSRQEAWLETRNVFGLRYRHSDPIPLARLRGMHLRAYTQSHVPTLSPVIVGEDGRAHPIGLSAVSMRQHSPSVQAFLAAIAAFLGRGWGEPITDGQTWDRLMAEHERAGRARRPDPAAASAAPPSVSVSVSAPADADAPAGAPGRRRSKGRRGRKRGARQEPAQAGGWQSRPPLASARQDVEAAGPADSKWPAISMPVRVFIGVLGVFFAVLTLNNALALLSALFSGRLSYSASRPSYSRSIIHFSEEPIWFCVTFLVQTLILLLIAGLAYGCLKGALVAPGQKPNKDRR